MRIAAILLSSALVLSSSPVQAGCSALWPSARLNSPFESEAIVPALVVAPGLPMYSGSSHIKSEINWSVAHDEIVSQLQGRAAVSLAYKGSGQSGLTQGQMTYGQAHYNVKEAVDHLIWALWPGVEAAIRRQLKLNEYEWLPDDIGQKVVFMGVGGHGVKNPVSFVGETLANKYGVPYHPVRKIENAKQPGRAELVLERPDMVKGKIIIWIDNGILSGGTFLESRQQLLAAGAKVVEPFFLGSAPGMTLRDINWIVGSAATPAPVPFARVVNSDRVPFTPWIDKAMQFSGDRAQAVNAFKELFSGLSSHGKLNVFFNTMERFQARGLPEQELLIWMAQLIEQDTALQSLGPIALEVAQIVTLRIQQNSTGNKNGAHRALFGDLASLLIAHNNRLPMNLAEGILWKIQDRFKITPVDVLQGIIADVVAHEGMEIDTSAVQAQVNLLNGYGLNEVDRDLMQAYFQGSDQLKSKLLVIREILFLRGLELAGKGMAGTYTRFGYADETPAQAISRLRLTLMRWHRWALGFGEAYKKDHPNADEVNIKGDGRTDKNAFKGVGKTIADEINEDTFKPLFNATDTIEEALKNDEIRPDKVNLRLSRSQSPGSVAFTDRPARVGFLPMKGDPWQIGHIFMMLTAIATHKLDKVVFMVDNSDPYRKAGLTSLTNREGPTMWLLKILSPFIEYTTISKDEIDLRTADGERAIYRLQELNRGLNIEWYYMAGSDHRHWDKTRKKDEKAETMDQNRAHSGAIAMEKGFSQSLYDKHFDTATKQWYFTQVAKPDGYQGEPVRIIFNQRHGEIFEPEWQKTLEALSGMPILTTYQDMDTSSTRIREQGHWWTVPYDVFVMAASVGFWGAEKASQVALSVFYEMQELLRVNPKTTADYWAWHNLQVGA